MGTPIYTLKVLTEFAAAHTLNGYEGACQRMHGHNWKVETVVKAKSLNEIGIAIDFHDIKQAARDIGDSLDHRYLNDLEPFKDLNPTAENIAAYIYHQLATTLNTGSIQVESVTLWETDRACVTYSEA